MKKYIALLALLFVGMFVMSPQALSQAPNYVGYSACTTIGTATVVSETSYTATATYEISGYNETSSSCDYYYGTLTLNWIKVFGVWKVTGGSSFVDMEYNGYTVYIDSTYTWNPQNLNQYIGTWELIGYMYSGSGTISNGVITQSGSPHAGLPTASGFSHGELISTSHSFTGIVLSTM